MPLTATFWVGYVNQYLEVRWQNLPASTDAIVVARSQNASGTFSELITILSPELTGPRSVYVVDSAFNLPYYYKLDARASGTLLQEFGPVFLPPIGQ